MRRIKETIICDGCSNELTKQDPLRIEATVKEFIIQDKGKRECNALDVDLCVSCSKQLRKLLGG